MSESLFNMASEHLTSDFQTQKQKLESYQTYRQTNPYAKDTPKHSQNRFYNRLSDMFGDYKLDSIKNLQDQDPEMNKVFTKVGEISPEFKTLFADLKTTPTWKSVMQTIQHLEECFWTVLNNHRELEELIDRSIQHANSSSAEKLPRQEELDRIYEMGLSKLEESYHEHQKELASQFQETFTHKFQEQKQQLEDYRDQLKNNLKADNLRTQRQEKLYQCLFDIFEQKNIQDADMVEVFAKAGETSQELKTSLDDLKTVSAAMQLITPKKERFEELFWTILSNHPEIEALLDQPAKPTSSNSDKETNHHDEL